MTSLLLQITPAGWFGIKIIAMYLFHYYGFFLKKTAQKAGLMGYRF